MAHFQCYSKEEQADSIALILMKREISDLAFISLYGDTFGLSGPLKAHNSNNMLQLYWICLSFGKTTTWQSIMLYIKNVIFRHYIGAQRNWLQFCNPEQQNWISEFNCGIDFIQVQCKMCMLLSTMKKWWTFSTRNRNVISMHLISRILIYLILTIPYKVFNQL